MTQISKYGDICTFFTHYYQSGITHDDQTTEVNELAIFLQNFIFQFVSQKQIAIAKVVLYHFNL